MIKGHCHTNLDEYKRFHWPEEFQEIPRVGDYVRSRKEAGTSQYRELRVVRVVHFIGTECGSIGTTIKPMIEVELHK